MDGHELLILDIDGQIVNGYTHVSRLVLSESVDGLPFLGYSHRGRPKRNKSILNVVYNKAKQM